MSVRVMAIVFERYPNGGSEMLLALALADHAHDDGTHIWPEVATLASKTRQSTRSVQYQLRRMEDAGWLEVVGNAGGGRGRPREYRISCDWLNGADLAPFAKDKGRNSEHQRVQPEVIKGATAIAPAIEPKEPSGTVTPRGALKCVTEDRFATFYAAYPRKTAKRDAAKAFARLRPDDELLAAMLAAIERQRTSADWVRESGRYIPHPATWLNGGRWEDGGVDGLAVQDQFAGGV